MKSENTESEKVGLVYSSSSDEIDKKSISNSNSNNDTTTTLQPPSTTDQSKKNNNRRMEIVSYMAAFFFSMIAMEIALETVSREFSFMDSLAGAVTLFQFGFCFLLPLVISRGRVIQTFPKSFVEVKPYLLLSFLVFGATGLATRSLVYVSYPTKVVFKSAKLIPTMIVSVFLKNAKPYSSWDYLSAALICLGAAGYSYNSSSSEKETPETSLTGIFLLTVSIFCDAAVPNVQQRFMSSSRSVLPSSSISNTSISSFPSDLSPSTVMLNTNGVGFLVLLAFMTLNGSLLVTIQTSMSHPQLFLLLSCIGIFLSTAVFAYTKLINASGSVIAVAVATFRKVATVILSYVIYPKPILPIHILSGFLVLIGVLINSFCRKRIDKRQIN